MGGKKLYTFSIGLLISILITSYFMISKAKVIKNTVDVIANTREKINTLNENLVYLSGFEAKAEEMTGILDEFSTVIPYTAEENSIIIVLNELALNNTLILNNIKFLDKKEEAKLVKVPLTISLKGNYFDIITYISDIRKLNRVFNISNIDIKREDNNPKNVVANVTLSTYNLSD